MEAFAFDGARLAFAHMRYRPDHGAADGGRHALCVDDTLVVPAPFRSPDTDRPDCPETD